MLVSALSEKNTYINPASVCFRSARRTMPEKLPKESDRVSITLSKKNRLTVLYGTSGG